jgi:hypothetical protein
LGEWQTAALRHGSDAPRARVEGEKVGFRFLHPASASFASSPDARRLAGRERDAVALTWQRTLSEKSTDGIPLVSGRSHCALFARQTCAQQNCAPMNPREASSHAVKFPIPIPRISYAQIKGT